MFARYNYIAGSTVANIMADIVAILTGTTDKNTLSASCDKTNTYIYNTYTNAEWILHDASAGTNQVVLKGARFDDPTNYEYALLDFDTVASKFGVKLYETWNETTHTGTNVAYVSTNLSSNTGFYQRINTSAGGSTIIYANKGRCILFQGNTATGYGDDTNKAWLGCMQRSRLSPWDTVAAGYPISAVVFGASMFGALSYSGGPLAVCRIKNPDGGSIVGSNDCVLKSAWIGCGGLTTATPIKGSYYYDSQSPVFKVPDGLGGFYAPLTNIYANNPYKGHLGGSFSDVCDVWLGVAYPFNLDEVVTGGKTYVFIQNTSAARATFNGTANLCVPKG